MDEVFRKAARSAIALWALDDDPDDLIQDLWVWYLERPNTQRKMDGLTLGESINTTRLICNQFLSERVLSSNTFNGRDVYSVNSVKEFLHGLSNNKYLREIMPLAMSEIQRRDDDLADAGNPRAYGEAIRSRYTDRVVPVGAAADRLSRAVKALTDEVNLMYLTAETVGQGSRGELFPDTRRTSGGHGDPTADIALLLMDSDQDIRDGFFEELSLDLQLKGEHAQPVRWDDERNTWIRDVPIPSLPGAVSQPEADASEQLAPTRP